MGEVKQRIEQRLREAFAPERLEITDDSAKHAGHAAAPAGGESHFTVEIVAAAFENAGRVQRHRLINQALAEELAGPVHALAITAKAPGE